MGRLDHRGDRPVGDRRSDRGRTGAEYQKVLERAQELKSSGQAAQPGEFRSSSGERMLAISSLAILLLLIDMIWKPGA